MPDFSHGHVILYAYLWAREYERGEESGRKARPTCVMLIMRGRDGKQVPLLYPITSKAPLPGAFAVKVPETEARRANLYSPSWVIVDEFNMDDLARSHSIEDSEPLGMFSRRFMSDIAAAAAAAMRKGVSRAVSRI
jgi:hypothetical protein